MCLDAGGGSCRPVNVWFKGADWMTRSLAKRSAGGGTIDSPGGGRFLEEFVVVGLPDVGPAASLFFPESGPSPRADLSSLAWIIDLCWSRTEMLRSSCSRIAGSCVWKPGDRQAKPTSCRIKPSLAVKGVAEGREFKPLASAVLVFKSNFFGLWRVLG